MIGVTLSSPGFEKLAVEARDRFVQATGLKAVILHTPEKRNYLTKLELPSLLKETVVWFDADLWFIQKCDLSEFDDQEDFIAVRDPGIYDRDHFPFHDSQLLDLDLQQYFNTGFFIWNERHVEAFREAKRIMSKNLPLKDFGEQSSLNAGVQRNCSLRLLSSSFNYMPFAEINGLRGAEVMSNPLTLHVAGYGTHETDYERKIDKLSALRYFEAYYTGRFHDCANHTSSRTS